jgi:hypothetical protein
LLSSTDSENRAVPRRSGETVGPWQLQTQPTGARFSADIHDISIVGVGLLADHQLDAGTGMLIEAGPAGLTLALELKAEVRHATMRPDGRWLLGCRFSRHLTTDDVERLG